MIDIMHVNKCPAYAYALANAGVFEVFDTLSGKSWQGVGRTLHRHIIRPRREYIEKNLVIQTYILYDILKIIAKIRCALHKVTTQERPVRGGKRGGILYLKKI